MQLQGGVVATGKYAVSHWVKSMERGISTERVASKKKKKKKARGLTVSENKK